MLKFLLTLRLEKPYITYKQQAKSRMAIQRKYKFDWLDHLFYTGKGGPAQWSMWFYLESLCVLTPLLLLLVCTGVMVIEQTVNTAVVMTSVLAAGGLAISLYSNRWLKTHRFTPQRERAYFRRYPGRKHYTYPILIIIMAYLTSSVFAGSLIFFILKSV